MGIHEKNIGQPDSDFAVVDTPVQLEMYELSGHDSITKHAFDRYKKDKQQDIAIRNQVEHSDSEFISKLFKNPFQNPISLLEQGLQNPNLRVQAAATKLISSTSEDHLPLRQQVY